MIPFTNKLFRSLEQPPGVLCYLLLIEPQKNHIHIHRIRKKVTLYDSSITVPVVLSIVLMFCIAFLLISKTYRGIDISKGLSTQG